MITDELVRSKIAQDEWASYNEIVQLFKNWELLAEEYTDDYQGDAVFIYRCDGFFGILFFGYGSCSGCDALQSALYAYESDDDISELTKLVNDMIDDTRWFDDLRSMIAWVQSSEFDLQWFGGLRETAMTAINTANSPLDNGMPR